MRCADRDGAAAATFASFGAPRSTTLPHAWHSPQRPTQRAVVQPHSVHWKESCFAMPGSLRTTTDKTGSLRDTAQTVEQQETSPSNIAHIPPCCA